ncbi:MAG: TetR/AcrR family transcriptional regulator C-terminal domain-containing protein [Sulfurifustis sp.]
MKTFRAVRRTPLTRERIYRAALDLIDATSVEELSMRRLAGVLAVDAMSIYHHVANKQALLLGIYQTVLEELPLPPVAGSWQTSLRGLGRRFYALARKYPKIFPHLVACPYATSREIEIYHRLREILTVAGLDEEDSTRTTKAIYTYATGIAQLAAKPFCHRSVYTTERDAACAEAAHRIRPEQDMNFSIELMISGIERLLERRGANGSKSRGSARAASARQGRGASINHRVR